MASNNRIFPQIYHEFEGPAKDGKPPRKYWIQDATKELFDEIIELFVTSFLQDEPICKYLNALSDIQSIEDNRIMQKRLLEENTSLVCMTKGKKGESILVGFNVLTIASSNDNHSDPEPKGWFTRFIAKFFAHIDNQREIFKEFGFDKCMKAMGLFVRPEYRGNGLGVKLLSARILLCKSMDIKITSTVFTSIVSQKQAYKAGYQDFYVVDYEELGKTNPEFYIPNIEEHTKSLKVLYKLVD